MCQKENYELKMADDLRYKTMVDSGQATLKALLFMNGGGTVTFLTFITHVTTLDKNGETLKPMYFVVAISLFITSTFLTVLSYGAIYATNCYSYIDGEKHDGKKRKAWFLLTRVFGFSSLIVFVIGCIVAGTALVVNSKAIFGS